MLQYFDQSTILVTGQVPANPFLLMPDMMSRAQASPIEATMVLPQIGEVEGHTIIVQWDGPIPPLKPNLVKTQITRVRDAFVRVGIQISAILDSDIFQFGPVTISGLDIKQSYFSLTAITLTEDKYAAGYGGQNLGTELLFGVGNSAGWDHHGPGGLNFIMLHEMVQNTKGGRAIVQQMFDRHLRNGGTASNYGHDSQFFRDQESMTNSLVRQIGDQIGINYQSAQQTSEGYPTYGYYSGSELSPNP